MVSRRFLGGSSSALPLGVCSEESESLLGGREEPERMELRDVDVGARKANQKLKVEKEEAQERDWEAKRNRPRDYFISVSLSSGDSLQTLALKYNVPLAELKRLNNLIKENELFALKKIKIPVRPGSILTESAALHGFGGVSGEEEWQVETLVSPLGTASEVSSPILSDDSEAQGPRLGSYSIELNGIPAQQQESPHPASKSAKRVKKILRNMDKDLELIRQENEVLVERSSSGSIGASPSNGLPLVGSSSSSYSAPFPSSGSDATKPSSASRFRSNLPLAIAAIVIIGLAVFLILEFSKYEVTKIELEHAGHHHPSEASVPHEAAAAEKGNAAAESVAA